MIQGARSRKLLTAIPRSWVGWDFELREDDMLRALLNLRWIGERGTLVIGGHTFELGREHWNSGAFFLKRAGNLIASADKPSALFRSFQVRIDHAAYCWEAESAFTRSFVLRDGNQIVGSMRPESVFTRRALVDLPEEISLERRAFLVWLVLLMWRRQKNSG